MELTYPIEQASLHTVGGGGGGGGQLLGLLHYSCKTCGLRLIRVVTIIFTYKE